MSKILTNDAAGAPTESTSLPRVHEKSPGSRDRYFLGIDGGGTKTHAVITDSTRHIIGEGFSGAANPLRVGLAEAVSHIEQAVAEACAQAGIELGDIDFACAAIAGINHPIHYHTMKDALDEALHIAGLELVTDARAALEGALDGKPGIVVIAGTGSIAIGINEAGQQARAGGFGPTLSDEGSGYDIARRALQAVVSAFDGRSPATLLTELVCKKLRVASPADLPGVIYNSDSEPVDIAPLAELVGEAAGKGDAVAREILSGAGRDLGRLVASVIEKLGLASTAFRIACVGSVFRSGEFVLESLREAVSRVAPRAEIGPPLFPPALGAAQLAEELA
ncbi:MAG TPA: BadF/BadG/BcrA/BcrD ATPase family protein [Blastocatellia bacterium]|nr:BadF/BadG/BcrA/BcrD ATPase family protein [Blastocatellia bacterium]